MNWEKHRDTILMVLLVGAGAAFAWHGGAFLFSIIKWPFVVAVVMGLGFMLGNDGGHAVKRWLRDVAWPWLKAKLNL